MTMSENRSTVKKENLEANQPLIQLIETYAKAKMLLMLRLPLHGCSTNIQTLFRFRVPKIRNGFSKILQPGMMILTDEEFNDLDKALEQLPVQGSAVM